MSQTSGPDDHTRRHEVVTSLQILTLTAELLAMALRDGKRSSAQLRERGQALWDANRRVVDAAQHLQAREVKAGNTNANSLAEAEPVREIRAFVGFVVHYAGQSDVERDVLAEYVDALHDRAADLIASLDEPPYR